MERDILGEEPIGETHDGRPIYPAERYNEVIHGVVGAQNIESIPSRKKTKPREISDEEYANDPRANEFSDLSQIEFPGLTVFDLSPNKDFIQPNLLPEIGREGIIPGIIATVKRAFNGWRVQPRLGLAATA